MEILNVWNSKKPKLTYYTVDANESIFKVGEYAIYKQFNRCYLYTFQGIGISQLAGINKDLIKALHEDKRPENPQQVFLFDRCKYNLERGLNLIN